MWLWGAAPSPSDDIPGATDLLTLRAWVYSSFWMKQALPEALVLTLLPRTRTAAVEGTEATVCVHSNSFRGA